VELPASAPPPFGGPAATKPSEMAPFCAHCPSVLRERQLQRLLGALRERGAASLRVAASCNKASKQSMETVQFCAHHSTVLLNGSCSGSWGRFTSAELSVSASPPFGGPAATKPLAMVPFCEHHAAALGERQLQRLLGALHERGAVSLRAAAFQRPGRY
jgi:hypothetical protein